MITTILLTTMLATQVPGPLPKNAAIVYSGLPASAQGWESPVLMLSHSVTGTVSKDSVAFHTVSLFKNATKKAFTVKFNLPVYAQNPSIGRGYDIKFDADWDNKPVKVSPYKEVKAIIDSDTKLSNGKSWEAYQRLKVISVPCKASSTHSLRISFVVPVGKSGLDGLQRIVAYDLNGAVTYHSGTGPMRFSLKYDTDIVFQKIAALPDFGWQVGPNGAYFQVKSFTPGEDALARFMFYPGGFDKIGDIK